MSSTRSLIYPNYPWTARVRKLAKKMFIDDGGKLDAESRHYESWAKFGDEAHRAIEIEKKINREKLKEERRNE